mgnify:CR=1 FL=1
MVTVPLARSRPREGRYGRIAIGLLVFIIYFNLLSAAKAWIEEGSISFWSRATAMPCVSRGTILLFGMI